MKPRLKTPVSYYGGKQTMLKHLLPLIPAHRIYTETFAGGAALLFAKEPAEVEVINDLNNELINFYWTASVNYSLLKREIDKTLHARGIHQHATYIYRNPSFFDHVQRAWAVWCLCKMSFASKMDGSFGYDKAKRGMSKKVTYAKDAFTQDLCDRLEKVTIERDNAVKVIKRFDQPEAFHFVDPPYVNSDCGHYSGMFTESDLVNLLELLSTLQGKFMLTMYPHDQVEAFSNRFNWRIVDLERTISSAKTVRNKKVEWIIMNYLSAS